MRKKVYGVFVAGGSGVRMGTEVPKQFLELGGRPILQQSIMKFLGACPEMVPVVALPADHISTWKQLCQDNRFDLPQIVVEGGITRFHSVRNALAKIPDGALVLIHDGVRPLLSVDLIRRILEVSGEERCVIPVTPVTDTLKSLVPAGDGTFVQSEEPDPSREGLFGAQTPQLFLSELIKDAYDKVAYNQSLTDDASVARAAKIPLTYIEGERYNIKITTPEDLDLARKLF